METRNELERLEGIVSRDMSILMEMRCEISNDLLEDFRQAILDETEHIKNSIIMTVCSVGKKAKLKKYIQSRQQSLITLSSQLLKYTHPEKLANESASMEIPLLCHYLYKVLEDLLAFVERHFTGYFNPDAWVPASYRLIAMQEIRQNLDELEIQLSEVGLDDQLRNIVFSPFREFLGQEPTNEITYRRINYLKTLKKELGNVKSHKDTKVTESVNELLIKLNFNSNEYFNHCTNRIALQVNKAKTQSEKLNVLAISLKEINQVRDRVGFIFDPRYKPLKEQIAGWLVEELNFQEKNNQLEIGFVEGDNLVSSTAKVQLDLSVAQIACLVRGFVEGGIIKNKNLSELIRLIVSIVRTKRSERVSADSFRMKYYNIEDSARLAVAERLRAIAEHLSNNGQER